MKKAKVTTIKTSTGKPIGINPKFEGEMKLARKVMRDYHNALKKLAE